MVQADAAARAALEAVVAVVQPDLAGAGDDDADLRALEHGAVEEVAAVAVGIRAVAAEQSRRERVDGHKVDAAAGRGVRGQGRPAVDRDDGVVVIGDALAAGQIRAVSARDEQGIVREVLGAAGIRGDIAAGHEKRVLHDHRGADAGGAVVRDGETLEALAVDERVVDEKRRSAGHGHLRRAAIAGFGIEGVALYPHAVGRVLGQQRVKQGLTGLGHGGVAAVGRAGLVPVDLADPGVVEVEALGVRVQAVVRVDLGEARRGVKLVRIAKHGGEAVRKGVHMHGRRDGQEPGA